MTSRPIDNERPPRFVTIDEETTCSCHGETLQDGSTALYWPLPAELLCERTYEHGEPAT